MTDQPNLPPSLPRIYGDKEIGQILKRATELQDEEPSAPSSSGLTLQELEEVAVEAGIDPRFLQQAALELGTNPTDSDFWPRFVGDELMLLRETTVPGELSDDGFERVASAIQIGTREHGQPSLLGRSLTWRAETPSKTRTVQVTGHGDVSRRADTRPPRREPASVGRRAIRRRGRWGRARSRTWDGPSARASCLRVGTGRDGVPGCRYRLVVRRREADLPGRNHKAPGGDGRALRQDPRRGARLRRGSSGGRRAAAETTARNLHGGWLMARA